MKFGRKENKISSSKIMQKMAERLVPDLFQLPEIISDLRLRLQTSQVDSPELPETPGITKMTENFTKVTKYLTKFKKQ